MRLASKPLRRAATGLALLAAILVVLFAPAAPAAESDKGIVADFVSKALSSNTSNVSIGAVEGALSSDVVIRDIVVADAQGPWLKLDRVRLVWSRLGLLQRRLEVDTLEIGTLQILRRPIPTPASDQPSGPLLPELPLKVIVKAFKIGTLALGAPVAGVAAELTAAGAASLGAPSEGLELTLEAHRLDAQGKFDVKLTYVPDTTKLALHVKFDEPAGGLVARLASLPGAPPVDLALDGEGPLDAFSSKLAFAAGPDIGANGVVDLARQGAGRRLDAKLDARVAGLMPSVAAEAFAGDTVLDGSIAFGDDGATAIDRLTLASKTAQFVVSGGIDASRRAELKLKASALPGAPNIGAFSLIASATGPLDALAAQATLSARNAQFRGGEIGALDASLRVAPDGAYGATATRIAITGDATMDGLALDDSALRGAIGARATLRFAAQAAADGVAHVSTLTLESDRVKAGFTGDASAARVEGHATLAAPDLAAFAKLSKVNLAGAVDAEAEINFAPKTGAAQATINAIATRFASGVGALDGFADGALTLRGGVTRRADGGYGFDHLTLVGAQGTLTADGEAGADTANVHVALDVPKAEALDTRLAGHLAASGDLSGSLDRLDAAFTAALTDGRLLGRAVPALNLEGDARDLTGAPSVKATLDGSVGGQQAKGALSAARTAVGGFDVDALSLSLGSALIDGRLTLTRDGGATGRLDVNAARLDDLSPLALTPLTGALEASIALDASDGKQNAAIRAKSATLSAAGAKIEGVDVDMKAADVFGAPSLEGHADVARATFGAETVSGLKLDATQASAGSRLDLRVSARGLAVEAQGLLAADARSLGLQRLAATGGGRRIILEKPASIRWGAAGVEFGDLALAVDGGRVTLVGRAGSSLDLALGAKAVPLSVLDLVKPGLGLSGALDAEASIKGTPSAPQGPWRVAIARFAAPQLKDFGLPPVALKGSGALAGGRASLDITLDAGRTGSLNLAGSAPLGAEGALSLKATGRLDLAAANGLLSPQSRKTGGSATIDMRVTGSAAHPNAQGSIEIRDGAFSDEGTGLKVEGLRASLVAAGDALDIRSATASTPNGGTIMASGNLRLDPQAGFPGTLRVTARGAQLLANPLVAATANVSLDASGALARTPRLAGRIDIVTMDIAIPGRAAGALRPLAGARHIDPPPLARWRLALAAKAKHAVGPPFDATLAIRISAPSRIFLRGRGVDAELSGDLTISGSTSRPQTTGGFDLRRGTFALLGKRLDFTRGAAHFRGDLIPQLDLLAQTNAGDLTAFIAITGPADQPAFAFSSQPNLPEDEIVSRILFDKSSGSLSPVQALQLANAIATLSGRADAFERLRKALGVDSLDIGENANGGATFGVTRSINSRLSVGVTTGAQTQDNGVSLDLDVTRRLRLQGGVNASGGSTAGVGYQFEY